MKQLYRSTLFGLIVASSVTDLTYTDYIQYLNDPQTSHPESSTSITDYHKEPAVFFDIYKSLHTQEERTRFLSTVPKLLDLVAENTKCKPDDHDDEQNLTRTNIVEFNPFLKPQLVLTPFISIITKESPPYETAPLTIDPKLLLTPDKRKEYDKKIKRHRLK